MSLESNVVEQMKFAMKSKNESLLRSLRAIKAEIMKSKTEPGASGLVSESAEIKILQKMVKQRKDSLEIYNAQNRTDLAKKEIEEIEVIETFLPKQLSREDLKSEISKIIDEINPNPKEIGKVTGLANKKLAGLADGKTISEVVKEILSQRNES